MELNRSHLIQPGQSVWRIAGKKLIRLYQLCISPLYSPCCRFHPTCSAYASEAISRFGLARGCWLTVYRIARCQPLCKAGVDLVPEKFVWFPSPEKEDGSPVASS